MFYQLSPVGNPVCFSGNDESETLLQVFGDTYQPRFFASGTAALAAAITAAIQLKSVDNPEVIFPAYGCPDLVSAAIFAGAKPVLVDLENNRPWMDLAQLSEKTNEKTVAVVAVDLFGISERMTELRILAEKVEAMLIEDSAQAFPGSSEGDIWKGDLVVLSFGRGKPVSLLGGGAVLVRNDALTAKQLAELQPNEGIGNGLAFKAKAALYNLMIAPRLYWLPQSLPFLHLGETSFQPLASIDAMDSARQSMLPANVKAYRACQAEAQYNLSTMINGLLADGARIIDLPTTCEMPDERRLLRYPLLVEPALRDQLLSMLQRSGLGPSRLYPAALPEISGLETLLSGQGVFPAAASFAERLLTLPTHSSVSQADVDKMRQLLRY